MQASPLPHSAPLRAYEHQAERLLAGHASRDERALELVRRFDPRFRTAGVPWLARDAPAYEVASIPFGLDDARTCVARGYDFADWAALAEWVADVARGGEVTRFEDAVEAVIEGDLAELRRALAAHPELARARSTRRNCFDPPVHRATLLHYVAANGVEGHRQRTPANAVAIATALLDAGAEPDALADFYGQPCATLALLVSSSHPAQAGVQIDLVHLLLDRGASIEGRGERWGAPLRTALTFGFTDVAEALVRRGARVNGLADAAALGRTAEVARLASDADDSDRHLALALAAQLGRTEAVRALLDAGAEQDRYNPEGTHAHATPLHQAVWGGHADVVALLLERGARTDLRDRIYDATPLGWAVHGGRSEIEALLRSRGAT